MAASLHDHWKAVNANMHRGVHRGMLHNCTMDERHLIAEWMERVMAATGWTPPQWARLAENMAPSNITRLIKNPGEASRPRTDTIVRLARAVPAHLGLDPPNLGSDVADLTAHHKRSVPESHDDGFVVHPVSIPTQSQMPRTLPVYGSAQGGSDGEFEMNGNIVDYVEMPPSLSGARSAYGVYVSGESMSPRFEPGWLLHVHPHKGPRPGDDVVIQVRPSDENSPPLAFVKTLVSWDRSGGKLVARQFNPVKTLTWENGEVVSVHKIVGTAHE